MAMLLEEREIDIHGKKAQCDFVNVESILEIEVKAEGFQVLFLLKFHCELNFIEQCWGYAKRHYQMLPPSSKEDDLERNVVQSLDAVEVVTMRRFVTRSLRFMDVYRKGLTGSQAVWVIKKYRGHKTVPENILCEVEKAGMKTSRGQPLPGNLKERIAALEQRSNAVRSTSPSIPPTTPTPLSAGGPVANSNASPNAPALRDKIARFEKKGGVPVPRGSFGLGAPPLAENAPLKRRGELYGNRMPSVGTVSRSASPSPYFDGGRYVSMPLSMTGAGGDGVLDEEFTTSPTSPSSDSVLGTSSGITPQHTGSMVPSGAITPQYTGSALTPQYTGSGNKEIMRGTAFATALELARKAETEASSAAAASIREASPFQASGTPEPSFPADVNGANPSTIVDETAPVDALVAAEKAPEATPSTDVVDVDDSKSKSSSEGRPVPSPLEISEAPVSPTLLSTPSIVLSPSDEPEKPLRPDEGTAIVEKSETTIPAIIEPPTTTISHTEPTPTDPSPSSTATSIPKPKTLNLDESTAPSPTSASTDGVSSPLGPFSLGNAVQDLGKVVANIQGMFPGQISPLAAPPSFRPFVLDAPAPAPATAGPVVRGGSAPGPRDRDAASTLKVKDKKSVAIPRHLQLDNANPNVNANGARVPDSAPAAAAGGSVGIGKIPQIPRQPATSSVALSLFSPGSDAGPSPTANLADTLALPVSPLPQPRAGAGAGATRPVSMIETSPSHVAVAQRVMPATSRGMPVYLPGGAPNSTNSINNSNKYEHFPPTPDHAASEFGVVTFGHGQGHKASKSLSGAGSFSAVVHRKVTEVPSSTSGSSSYSNFYSASSSSKAGQGTQKGEMAAVEMPLSPGYGELATLLHEAALLELTLEQGGLPGEAGAQERKDGEKKEEEEGNAVEKENDKDKEERERQAAAAARAKVEEEQKKHMTTAKARAKQEAATESKAKSSFRNPLLRSKSSHKRDASTSSEAPKDREPVRSKSVLLSFRPLPQPQTPTSTSTQAQAQAQTQNTSSTLVLPPLGVGTDILPIPEKEVLGSPTSEGTTTPHQMSPKSSASASVSNQTSPKSTRYFSSTLRRFASSSKTSLVSASQPRDSVSASSEMSSEDSAGIPTPSGNHAEGSAAGGAGGFFGGSGIGWPSLSPKKSPTPSVGRAASFTDKIFSRGRKNSTVSNGSSVNSAYDTIDRMAKSSAAKSAASLIPPLDPVSYQLDVPVPGGETDQRLPTPELVSPRRSASLYVPSSSQFPPVYSARPTSSFYSSIPATLSEASTSPPRALDAVDEDKLTSPNFAHGGAGQSNGMDALFSVKPTSPLYTPAPKVEVHQAAQNAERHPQNLDAALFSVKPTSPIYTPHHPALAMRSEETITDSPTLLPSPGKDAYVNANANRASWISNVSMDSSASSIPSPFFDSFPPVPEEMPLPPALPGRQRSFHNNNLKPALPQPPATPSFFETAPPLSSAAVGAEFTRSATLTRDHRR